MAPDPDDLFPETREALAKLWRNALNYRVVNHAGNTAKRPLEQMRRHGLVRAATPAELANVGPAWKHTPTIVLTPAGREVCQEIHRRQGEP